MSEQVLEKSRVNDTALTSVPVSDMVLNKLITNAAASDKVTTSQLLDLTRAVLCLLAINNIFGIVWIGTTTNSSLIWAGVVYSLAMSLGCIILVCTLIYLTGRIRIEG